MDQKRYNRAKRLRDFGFFLFGIYLVIIPLELYYKNYFKVCLGIVLLFVVIWGLKNSKETMKIAEKLPPPEELEVKDLYGWRAVYRKEK